MIFLKSINCYSLNDQRAFILSHALSNPQVINVKLVQTKLWKRGKQIWKIGFKFFWCIFHLLCRFSFPISFWWQVWTQHTAGKTGDISENRMAHKGWREIFYHGNQLSHIQCHFYQILNFFRKKKSWNMLNSKSFFHAWFVQKIESESSVVKTFTI